VKKLLVVIGSLACALTPLCASADEVGSGDEKGKRPARQIEVLSKTTVFTLGETIPITFRFTNHGKTPWELLVPERSPHVEIVYEAFDPDQNNVSGFTLERGRAIRTVDSNGVVTILMTVEEVSAIVIDPGKSHKFTYVFNSWRYPLWQPGRKWVSVKFKPGRNAKVMKSEKLSFDVVQTERSVPMLISFAKDRQAEIPYRKWASTHLKTLNAASNFNWPRYDATFPMRVKAEKQNQRAIREFEVFWKKLQKEGTTKQALKKANALLGVSDKLFEAHYDRDLQRSRDEQQRKQGRQAPSK
jgi:hypothetical protein